VQFSVLARVFKVASRDEDHLLSWQRPDGPMWRDISRAGLLPRLCAGMLALAAAALACAQASYPLLGAAAPDFALRASAGDNVRLSEHRGEVVVLSFWSSRCTPCRTQLTALNRSFLTYRSAGLAMFGVGVDDVPAQALDFARSTGVGFAMLLDPEKSVSRSYQVDNLPMTVLIDRSGVIRYVLRDYSPANETLYLQELRALLNE
jgi:peroxiredoxin